MAAHIAPAEGVARHVRSGESTPTAQPLLVLSPGLPASTSARVGLVAEAGRRGVIVATLERTNGLRAVEGAARGYAADALAVCGHPDMQAIVAAVAAGRDLPFACIPSGPDDLLACDMNAGSDDPELALTRFLDAHERGMDLAEVNGIAFVNYVALGLRVQPHTPLFDDPSEGSLADRARIHRDRPSRLRGLISGERRRAPALLVFNNRFAVRGRSVGSRSRIDAGRLSIAILDGSTEDRRKRSRARWRERSSARLELSADGPMLADIDGRPRILTPPLRFRIMPGALRARMH
jgi:diacylglycerol kinase family enzyme